MTHHQQLTDKDIAADMLTEVKNMAHGYMMGVLESQDQTLRQTFKDYSSQCLNEHEKIFNIMHQNGWYKVPMVLDEA